MQFYFACQDNGPSDRGGREGTGMKKSFIVFGMCALSFAFASFGAEAKSYSIGDSRAVATVVIPDSWETEVDEDGIETTSPDEGVSLSIEAVEIKDVETAIKEGIKYFTEAGVTIDPSTQTQRQITMAGKPAVDISWKGKDSDGPTNVGLTFVILSPKDSVLVYFWGTDEAAKQNATALNAISESIKAVEQ